MLIPRHIILSGFFVQYVIELIAVILPHNKAKVTKL